MIPAPLRSQVRAALERAWAAAIESGALPALPDDAARPTIEVERPANPEHGDLASNLAMKLARPYQRSPLELATLLAGKLVRDAGEEGLRLPDRGRRGRPARLPEHPVAARRPGGDGRRDPRGARCLGPGRNPTGPRKVNVEFVSANPTGPLTIGNARGAFIGDLLSRVLEAGGQDVTREYYFNDVGGQIHNLGASIVGDQARRAGAGGWLPRGLRRRSRSRRCRPTSGRPRHGPGADAAADRRPVGRGHRPAGDRSKPRAARRPFRCLEQRRPRCTTRAGSNARSSACARTGTCSSRTAPSGSGRPPSATTRTGSSIRSERASRPTSRPTSAT